MRSLNPHVALLSAFGRIVAKPGNYPFGNKASSVAQVVPKHHRTESAFSFRVFAPDSVCLISLAGIALPPMCQFIR
jgi:hypothetical protein